MFSSLETNRYNGYTCIASIRGFFFLYQIPFASRASKKKPEIFVAAGALPTRAACVLEIIPAVLPPALITTRRLIRIVQPVGGCGGRESGRARKNLKTVIGLLEHARL